MRKALVPVCLAAVAALAACSDNNNPASPSPAPSVAPNPTPTTGCTQTTLATATRALGWNVLDTTPFTTTGAGRVDITVDWQNAQNNVGAFVVEAGSCTAQRFNNANCSFLAESGGDKPHKLSANLPAGSYELLLNDFGGARGSSSETATVQVVLSTGCPAS